jgi:hypothetical protein
MDMTLVRVHATVRDWVKVVPASPDLPVVNDVVRRWMFQHRVQEGDHIQVSNCEINSMYATSRVWVVIASTGYVRSVAEPPVGTPLPGVETLVNLRSEAPQRES